MQDVDLLIRNAGQMAPLSDGEEGPLPGRRMDLWTLVKDGAIGVLKGRIVAVGETSDVLSRTRL
ncbi:MAG: imidazolonepropionase, partial [Candidatus Eisenbacteria bacterium]|nr:imidazolonepropionase [Candidatus Eisenbacteria bacterium]